MRKEGGSLRCVGAHYMATASSAAAATAAAASGGNWEQRLMRRSILQAIAGAAIRSVGGTSARTIKPLSLDSTTATATASSSCIPFVVRD